MAVVLLLLAGVLLVSRIPPPSYLFGEELRAREAIRQFLSQDQGISQRWGNILATGQRDGLSFDQLAGRIEADVTANYEHSFEQLMAASPDSAVPSAKTLEALQGYATQRADASRALAEGLRSNDRSKIRQALKQAQQVPPLSTSGTGVPAPQ